MRIGVISDTHIPISAKALPAELYEHLKTCDLIVHAGDIVELSLIDELNCIAETRAVHGNMDSPEAKEHLPDKMVFDVYGKKFGVIHGAGTGPKVLRSVKGSFGPGMDVVIFGHSHTPLIEQVNGTIYMNPGSPTDVVFAPYRSFGIIDIKDGEVIPRIVRING